MKISNVAEEFENPKKDFVRSIILSVLLISALYVAVAFVTIGTLGYEAGGNIAPFAVILSHVLGGYGAAGTAILAVFIIFGTENAYTTGMSRVFYAVSRDGGFPRALDHINQSNVPDRSLIALFGSTIPVFVIYYFFDVNLETALLVPSGAAILVYIIGSAAGIKILGQLRTGLKKRKLAVLPIISLAISLIVLPFIGWLLSFSIIVSIAALIYVELSKRRKTNHLG